MKHPAYYFRVFTHVITHKMAVSRPFYDLGGWLGPPQQVSAKKIFRATQPPFSRGRKQAKNRPFWTGHL